MVTTPDRLITETTESELVVEEFRNRIISTLRKDKERIKEVAEKEAKAILAKAYQDSANLTSRAQEESKQIITLAKEQAARDTDILLAQVQIKAEQIVKNAEELTRRDAREKTKKEVESILKAADEEANRIVSIALEQAKTETKEIIDSAKKEGSLVAKQIRTDAEKESRELILAASEMKQKATNELTGSARKAEEIAQNIIEEAKAKAQKEAEDIIEQAKTRTQKERDFTIATTVAEAKRAAETESTQILIKAKQEAENIFNTARERVKVQLEESSKLMTEMQQKMHLIIDTAVLDSKKTDRTLDINQNQVPKQTFNHLSKSQESTSSPDIKPSVSINYRDSATDDAQRKINSLFYDEEKHTYEGRVKIDIAPPVDIEQIGILGEYLAKTPNLKVLQKGEAEDGSAWIEIDLLSSTTLLDILRKIPEVKDVVGCKSYIIVALKSHQVV